MKRSAIFLVGPRGSGKSTVGRVLAETLGWDWLDADAELEARCGKCIRAVFDEEGEAGFRRHEAAVLEDLCLRDRVIVATGGGVVLREHNRERLRASGRVVCLTADVETLWRRISEDPRTHEARPALTRCADGRAEVEEVLREREPLYRSCADIVVDTSDRTPEEVARLVLSSLTPGN